MDTLELRPQPGKQEKFLQSQADIAIFGGAAGSGKSFGLLLEQLYDKDNGQFRSVIFRRTIPMIRQPGGLLDTSEQIYPLLGAKPNQSTLEWQFPSGATVKFSGMELEQDRFGWQGAQIALISFDELQEFSENQFWFLVSRNRSMSGARFHDRLGKHLKKMYERRDKTTDWMFPSSYDPKVPVGSFRSQLEHARSVTGQEDVGFHHGRHYFISHAVMAGVDFRTIAQWVSHRDGGRLIDRKYGSSGRFESGMRGL